eukprot:TRINITY_DN1661_c0_g1_i3.p1 TRINITY_DN1661_c0_g1~~TRINITY_DN1661_c0_g1_i3.p1  ORF type:complete len:138 (+),score=56.50 TRINITY_DN1661_c0_g1_i3:27-416(+)
MSSPTATDIDALCEEVKGLQTSPAPVDEENAASVDGSAAESAQRRRMVEFYQKMQGMEERKVRALEEAAHLEQKLAELQAIRQATHQQLAAELQSLHRDVEEARPRIAEAQKQLDALEAHRDCLKQAQL